MVVLFIGVVLGVLIAVFPIPELSWPALHVTGSAVAFTHRLVLDGMQYVDHGHQHSTLPLVVGALAEALVPGISAAGLLLAAQAGRLLRGTVSLLCAVGVVAAFFFLPWHAAVPLVVFGLLVGGIALLVGTAVTGALAFLGAFLATSVIRSVWSGSRGQTIHYASLVLAQQTHVSVAVWQSCLSLALVVLCAGALISAVHSSS